VTLNHPICNFWFVSYQSHNCHEAISGGCTETRHIAWCIRCGNDCQCSLSGRTWESEIMPIGCQHFGILASETGQCGTEPTTTTSAKSNSVGQFIHVPYTQLSSAHCLPDMQLPTSESRSEYLQSKNLIAVNTRTYLLSCLA